MIVVIPMSVIFVMNAAIGVKICQYTGRTVDGPSSSVTAATAAAAAAAARRLDSASNSADDVYSNCSTLQKYRMQEIRPFRDAAAPAASDKDAAAAAGDSAAVSRHRHRQLYVSSVGAAGGGGLATLLRSPSPSAERCPGVPPSLWVPPCPEVPPCPGVPPIPRVSSCPGGPIVSWDPPVSEGPVVSRCPGGVRGSRRVLGYPVSGGPSLSGGPAVCRRPRCGGGPVVARADPPSSDPAAHHQGTAGRLDGVRRAQPAQLRVPHPRVRHRTAQRAVRRVLTAPVHLAGVHPVSLLQQLLVAFLPLQRLLHQLPSGARPPGLSPSRTLQSLCLTSADGCRTISYPTNSYLVGSRAQWPPEAALYRWRRQDSG